MIVKKNATTKQKNMAGRIPETTRIVQNNLYPNLDKIRISKKNTNSRPKTEDENNISVKIFSVQGCG